MYMYADIYVQYITVSIYIYLILYIYTDDHTCIDFTHKSTDLLNHFICFYNDKSQLSSLALNTRALMTSAPVGDGRNPSLLGDDLEMICGSFTASAHQPP